MSITVNTDSITKLSTTLQEIADAFPVEAQKATLVGLTPVIAEARSLVAPYGSKAGQTIRAVAGPDGSVLLTAGEEASDLAALLERGNAARPYAEAFWRHPVYGNFDNWAKQKVHPFLRPAIRSQAAVFLTRLSAALFLQWKDRIG